MARGSSMFPAELFNDEGFRQLDATAQRLLMWLWIHPDLNCAGVIAIQSKEWAASAKDLTEELVALDAKQLRADGWVDYDDGQLWIRPWMTMDGAVKSPSTYISAARAVKTVRSRKLRRTVWELFATFPRPLAPVPDTDDDPDGKKAAKAAWARGLNESVDTAYAELERVVSGLGVRESLPIPHGIPHPTPYGMGSVGVEADDDVEGDHPREVTETPVTNGNLALMSSTAMRRCTGLGCTEPSGHGPRGKWCQSCDAKGVAY